MKLRGKKRGVEGGGGGEGGKECRRMGWGKVSY